VDRIKQLSMLVLKDNKTKFSIDFNENKITLDSLSTITSKVLRNRVAGYITRLLRNESIALEKLESVKRQEQKEEQNEPIDLVTESASEETVQTKTS
jgi:small subunit ribosomal protein S17e